MYTNPKLSLINVPVLNYLLRSYIFVNNEGQLCAVHLILDYEPISRTFLDVGNSIDRKSVVWERVFRRV